MNENFLKWFSNSVTKYENNEPMVFYHKSRSSEHFTEFRHKDILKNEYNNDYGFYFVQNNFKHFVEHLGNGNEYYCYLKITNPLYVYDKIDGATDSLGNHYQYINFHEHLCMEIIQKGFDSIIIQSSYFYQYIVFESNQIKHVENNGLFSYSPNIYT